MRRRGKHENRSARKQLPRRAAAMLLLTAVLLLAGGLTARYFWQTWSEYAAVTSEPFYFTAELLGDSEMVMDDSSHFSLENPETGTWHLYGGGEQTVDIRLQNYYDELRVTQDAITYSATLVQDSDINATLTDTGGAALADSLTLGTANADGTYAKAENTLRLTIPDCRQTATVTVTIQSTRPYKKTMELSFAVYPAQRGLTYVVVDSANSPYAELIIRNGTGGTVQPTVDWSGSSLSIDNTNALTFKTDFVPQDGMVDRRMMISRALNPGESVSIYFFKHDDSKNYATDAAPVHASTITIVDPQ